VNPREILKDFIEYGKYCNRPWDDRPALRTLLNSVRPGDTVLVEHLCYFDWRPDRLAEVVRLFFNRKALIFAPGDRICLNDGESNHALLLLQAIGGCETERQAVLARRREDRAACVEYKGGFVPVGKMIHQVAGRKILVDRPGYLQIRDEIYFRRLQKESYRLILEDLKLRHPHMCSSWRVETLSVMMKKLHKDIMAGREIAPVPLTPLSAS
jgi:hypothetical protein